MPAHHLFHPHILHNLLLQNLLRFFLLYLRRGLSGLGGA